MKDWILSTIFNTYYLNNKKIYFFKTSEKDSILNIKNTNPQKFINKNWFKFLILKIIFKKYYIVFPPTKNKEALNTIANKISCLSFKDEFLYKKSEQKLSNVKKRSSNNIFLKNKINLKNKNILIIDDICTTGATLAQTLSCIEKNNPKNIEILFIYKKLFII